MANRTVPFVEGEWYHCYTRGVEKRTMFENGRDYERFIEALYLCNTSEPYRRDDFLDLPKSHLFSIPKTGSLVAVAAYCLMPNHFHLLLKPITKDGITHYMRKLGTSYTMYFNRKYDRVGGLFVKPFRAKHVSEDMYFKRVAQYIHLNPAEIFESKWKEGVVKDVGSLVRNLSSYPYSSYMDYLDGSRPEYAVLDPESVAIVKEGLPEPQKILEDMRLYYASLPTSVR